MWSSQSSDEFVHFSQRVMESEDGRHVVKCGAAAVVWVLPERDFSVA